MNNPYNISPTERNLANLILFLREGPANRFAKDPTDMSKPIHELVIGPGQVFVQTRSGINHERPESQSRAAYRYNSIGYPDAHKFANWLESRAIGIEAAMMGAMFLGDESHPLAEWTFDASVAWVHIFAANPNNPDAKSDLELLPQMEVPTEIGSTQSRIEHEAIIQAKHLMSHGVDSESDTLSLILAIRYLAMKDETAVHRILVKLEGCQPEVNTTGNYDAEAVQESNQAMGLEQWLRGDKITEVAKNVYEVIV